MKEKKAVKKAEKEAEQRALSKEELEEKAIRKTEKLMKREEKRLQKIYESLEENKQKVTEGLIQRAAFMRISLLNLEQDLNKNGFTEDFSQGDQEPYKRKRPEADLYNTINSNYQKIIKQLTDLLPKDKAPPVAGDDFENF